MKSIDRQKTGSCQAETLPMPPWEKRRCMALHFTTIPCEPITALGHKESHILAILFTVLTAFCARFEALKTFLYVFINEFF